MFAAGYGRSIAILLIFREGAIFTQCVPDTHLVAMGKLLGTPVYAFRNFSKIENVMFNNESGVLINQGEKPPFVRRMVELRFGIGFLVTLALWTVIVALFAPPEIIANAMRLETFVQLVAVITMNSIAAVFAVSLLRVLFKRYSQEHSISGRIRSIIGNGDEPWAISQLLVVFLVALPTPLVLLVIYGSELSGIFASTAKPYSYWLSVCLAVPVLGLGAILAYTFLYCLGGIKTCLFGSEKDTKNFLPFEAVNRNGVFPQRVPRALACLPFESIDYQLAIYSFLLAIAHFVTTRVFAWHLILTATAPLAIVLIIWIAGMLLTGLAYWLDKYRVPVLVALLIAMLVFNVFMDRAYTLKPLPSVDPANFTRQVHEVVQSESNALLENRDRAAALKEAAKPLEDAAWNSITKRIKLAGDGRSSGKRVAIIVTCPGGGIHAAAWSSYVLETLCQAYPRFRDSICVVSGVSGGSVGALCFVSTNYASAIVEDSQFTCPNTAFGIATESSLEQISIGLMTDDLYGAFFPPLSLIDRGQRLEDSFKDRLPERMRTLTLNHWGKIAQKGEMPIVVFNATDAVTGRRILFDSLPTPIRKSNIGLTSRPYNYRELLEATDGTLDLLPMSGARASASFPYVSTFTNIRDGNAIGQAVAIGDGGYVDNEGIVTAVDWIQFLLEKWSSKPEGDRPFDQILLLRIMPAVNSDSLEPPSSPWLAKNLRWLTGPLETIANVRSTSQSERGNLETDLAALYFASPSIDTKSTSQEAEVTENVAMVYGMSPEQSRAKPANRTREEAARERFLNRLKDNLPEQWNKLQQINSMKASSSPVAAVVGPDLESSDDLPVLVIEIPFEPDSDLEIVPLNWKLTRQQKGWYERAWRRVENSQWEDFETLKRLFAK
jgi:hypothetical protein